MPENPPLVTVMVPAFNAVPFIARALESVLNGQNLPLEVLVVDDASKDGTADFVQERFVSDERVKVIRLPTNGGPAVARNVALTEAAGSWAAVLDADDAYEPGHLQSLVSLASRERADIAAANFVFFDVHRGVSMGSGIHTRSGVEHLDCYKFVSGARPLNEDADFGLLKPMFNVRFLRDRGLRYPEDVRHGEDVELIIHALLEGANYVLDWDRCSYLYTSRDSGLSRTPVDYDAQVRRTLSFLDQPKIKSDKRLRALIKERAKALYWLQLERNLYMEKSSKFTILRQALRSTAGRQWVLSRFANKIGV